MRTIGAMLLCAGLAGCGQAPWDRPPPARIFYSHADAQRYLASDIAPHVKAFQQTEGAEACRSDSLWQARNLADKRTEDRVLRAYLGTTLLDLADLARDRLCLDEAEVIYRDIGMRYAEPGLEVVQRRAAAGLEQTRVMRERMKELERLRDQPPEPAAPPTSQV